MSSDRCASLFDDKTPCIYARVTNSLYCEHHLNLIKEDQDCKVDLNNSRIKYGITELLRFISTEKYFLVFFGNTRFGCVQNWTRVFGTANELVTEAKKLCSDLTVSTKETYEKIVVITLQTNSFYDNIILLFKTEEEAEEYSKLFDVTDLITKEYLI